MQFIDPRTDFAFRKIFGSEESKEILISFLNNIMDLPEERAILDLRIMDPYQLPKIKELKYSILDVKCRDKRGITYVVEMQLLEVEAFHKRVVYNVCKAYSSQLPRGSGYPELHQVVGITISDFVLFDSLPSGQYISKHLLKEDISNESYLDEIMFYFVELPKFTRELKDLENLTEKWVYFLKHTGNLEVVPKELNVAPIDKAFAIANRSGMSREELETYEKYLMAKQDEIGALKVAERRGIEIGEKRGKEAIAKKAKKLQESGRLTISEIAEITGLSKEEIENF